MSTYFITGATGAVGSALVPLLMEAPDTELRLLIRAESDAALADRLAQLFAFWEWPADDPRRQRVRALRGDAAEPRFALDDAQYRALAGELTHIIHCAASVRMNEPLDKARRSAVGSATAILELARAAHARGRLAKLEFISTVGIAGKRQGLLPERWIDEARAFHNSYEQSKAEAEERVRAAVEQEGLPITVHRPSMVIGDSRSGRIIHFQIFYFICEFLSGRKTHGLYPDFGAVQLDVIPVDCVASAIVASSRDPGSGGRILHLCSGPQAAPALMALRHTVRDTFRAHGREVPRAVTLPRGVFALLPRIAALLAPADKRRALSTLPIYLDYLADQQGFDNARYRACLAARGESLPAWQDYLPTVLDAYLDARWSEASSVPRMTSAKRSPQG